VRRVLTWLAVVVVVGLMVVLVAGVGWLVYVQAKRGIDRFANARPASPSLARPLPEAAFEELQSNEAGGLVETLLGLYLRFRADDLVSSMGDGEPSTFTVQPGETTGTVAGRLAERGLILDAELFRLYMRYRGIDRGLEAGDYELSTSMSMAEIAEKLQRAWADEVVVTIPEGWRMEQIAELLSEQLGIPTQEFLELARVGSYRHAFLNDRPDEATLEGYLFPDTYRLPAEGEASALIMRMLDNFGQRLTLQMRRDMTAQGLSLFDIVTLASIVEREGVVKGELPLIAGVYRNRLAQGMKLDADPTVQYAMGFQPDTGQWWKRPMRLEEYGLVDSPYNTYLYRGLPPGPICNPGLASIEAAIYPEESDYLFFVRNDVADDGTHVFARTLGEHESNRQQYQN
jgi:UPF0755 protein